MRYTNPVLTTFVPRDGDTLGLTIRLSGSIDEHVVARLSGYDCPELRRTKCGQCGLRTSPYELEQAVKARTLVIEFIASQGQLSTVREERRDSFGRELIQLHHEVDDIITDLGTALHDADLATIWPTRWHTVYDPRRDGT